MSPDDGQRTDHTAPPNADTLPDSPPHDEEFRLLAAPQRRVVLASLSSQTDRTATDLDALAEDVAESDAIDADERTLAIKLHHVHLPMLDDADFVEYEPGAQRVRIDEVPDWATQLGVTIRQSN